jgi:hypothetical protein
VSKVELFLGQGSQKVSLLLYEGTHTLPVKRERDSIRGRKVVLQLKNYAKIPKGRQTIEEFVFFFGWERPKVGTRVWFSAHQVMDDVGQGPDNRNAKEGDAE